MTSESKTTREAIEVKARELCKLAGHNPDAIGEPPNDNGCPTEDHAFPRWMAWMKKAEEILNGK